MVCSYNLLTSKITKKFLYSHINHRPMERKKYLIVSGGGTGTRMGSVLPKQFLELGGIPILRRTITVFVQAIPDIQIITVLPEAHVSYWRK